MAIPVNVNESYLNDGHHHHHAICWKSILAGLVISIMAFLATSALGLGAIGSITRAAVDNSGDAARLATASGIWLIASIAISLFLGSFYASRSSLVGRGRVGGSYGLVVASLFFVLLVSGLGNIVGGLSAGIGGAVKGLGAGASDISQNPAVQDVVNSVTPDANLKTDPQTFTKGLLTRLVNGDTESAKAYYAYNTGMAPAEVDAKIAELQTRYNQTVQVVKEKAAQTAAAVGWTLFVTFLLGLGGAFGGGLAAARCNVRDPLFGQRVRYDVRSDVRRNTVSSPTL